MNIRLSEVSDEHVVSLTKVLARRPNYGIAIPSRRWHEGQEEKIRRLPAKLLKPSNVFQRIATRIQESMDARGVPQFVPRAVLCATHDSLNPSLIRRLFMAIAYEVTVYTDSLRSWQGKTTVPGLSAFVGRLDAITALWTEPQLFYAIYGLAPFDNHLIFVRSGCEACCLAAVGANGQALSDLRAALVDRMERRGEHSSSREPRLYRFVEAWINHLRKPNEDIGRPEECRGRSEVLLAELRRARPQIKAWRAEQKKIHAELRAAKLPVFTELRRTSSGVKITPVPNRSTDKRRTRNGIPVAIADIEGPDERRAAVSKSRRDSIYRPDSLAGYSDLHKPRDVAHDAQTGGRPGAPEPEPEPEPDRTSNASGGFPTQSFLHRFEHEIPLPDEEKIGDDTKPAQDVDERDRDEEERSRIKVQDWYSSRLAESHVGLAQEEAKSVISLVHPAFRPDGSYLATSAVPVPLQYKKDREQGAGDPENRPRSRAVSEWTDCTVYTVDHGDISPTEEDAPPMPEIPSEYRTHGQSLRGGEPPQSPSKSRPEASPTIQKEQFSSPFPPYADPFKNEANSSESVSKKSKNAPINWPAPPYGTSSSKGKSDPKRFVLAESDVDSHLSDRRQAFLRDRFKVKNDDTQSPRSSAVPSLSSHGRTVDGSEPRTPVRTHGTERVAPQPVTVEDAMEGHAARGCRDDATELAPDDSVSNVRWNRKSFSSVTQLGTFKDKM